MKTITINGVEYELTPKSETKKDCPEIGEEYYYVRVSGEIYDAIYSADTYPGVTQLGNCFWGEDAEQQAEYHKLRLEAMAKRWKPDNDYWFWDFQAKKADTTCNENYQEDYSNFFLGNIHKTKEEAEEYGKKYHDAFMALFN